MFVYNWLIAFAIDGGNTCAINRRASAAAAGVARSGALASLRTRPHNLRRNHVTGAKDRGKLSEIQS